MKGVWLQDLTWPEAKNWIDGGAPVILPIGAASKEHGHHLPLKTDWMLAEALSRGVLERLRVLVAPIVGFGYYPAFRHFPGSQHLSPKTFGAVLSELLGGFIAQGAKNLAVINTGVSTEPVLRIVVRELYEKHRVRVATADIRNLGMRSDPLFEQKLGGHADEHETSVIMALDPSAVRLDRAVTDYGHELGQPKSVFYQPTIFDLDEKSGIDYTARGARGDPTLATAAKGEAALKAMIDDLVDGLTQLFPESAR